MPSVRFNPAPMIRTEFVRRVAWFVLGTGLVSLLVAAALLWQFDRLTMQRAERELSERAVWRAKLLGEIHARLPAPHRADPAQDALQLGALAFEQAIGFAASRPAGRILLGWATPQGIGYRRLGAARGETEPARTAPREGGGPLVRGLEGGTGVVPWRPPEGEPVLAAYAPIAGTGLVLVATETLSDLRAPLLRAALLALALAGLLVAAVTALYVRWTAPLLRGIATDITGLKRVRVELDHLFDCSPDIQAIADIDGFFKRVNPAFEQILGYPGAEIVSQPFRNFIHEEDREAWAEARQRLAGGDFVRHTNRCRHRDGEYRWIAWHGKRDPSTGLIYVGGRDVTEERRKDLALAANEERLRVLIDNLPAGIYETDRYGNAILVNGRFTAITGLRPEQVLARHWIDHVHAQDRERVVALGRRVAESPRPLVTEFRFVRPDGHPVWVEATAVALRDAQGRATGYLGSLTDLTLRKRADAAQVQSYNLMGAVSRVQSRFIAETPPADIFRQTLDDLLLITESRVGLIALTRDGDAAPGEPSAEGSAGPWESLLSSCRPGETETARVERRLLDFAGQALANGRALGFTLPRSDPPPHECVALPVRHARRLMAVVVLAGRPQGYGEEWQRSLEPVLATYGAIAEAIRNERRRRDAEQDITQKNQQLESIFANLAEGVVIVDRSGRIAQVNRLARSMLDWAEIPAHTPADLSRILGFREQDGTPFPNERLALVRCMAEGQTVIGQQAKLMRPWGEVALQVSAAPLFDPAGRVNGAVAILGDITELKRMDRLKSEFISTVSHEVRTPLAAMLGYTQLILDGDAGEVAPEQREYLGIIASNTARLAQLIGNLLDIERIESGKIKLERKALNLSELLLDVETTFRLAAKQKGLLLATRVAPHLGVAGDADSLNQVFSNLLSNAVKYTREGTIRIEARSQGGEVRVTVADSGIGMTPESLSKLFTKFYRAEDDYARQAGGTGLGLAISRAIVAQHGGRIEASSAHGKGTEFRVFLPSAEVPGAPRRRAAPADSRPAG
jgi:two-component system phosphate regulon sensor histidine kinase PhoR